MKRLLLAPLLLGLIPSANAGVYYYLNYSDKGSIKVKCVDGKANHLVDSGSGTTVYLKGHGQSKYKNPEIHLTENGCAYPDKINKYGKIQDKKRIEYMKKYLNAVKKSIKDGAKVKSYFAWSFMDNFEWALGYEKRFGLVYVDFKSLKRIPKESYYFFKKIIKNNSIPS